MQVGIIGAGAMGTGIAQVAAQAGEEVFIWDKDETALARSRDQLQYFLNRLAEKGKMTDADAKAIFGRIYFVSGLESFSDVDLVIEAIVEKLEVKQSVFQKLELYCKENVILASNTSSISITAIAAACDKPENIVGIHFFNPAPLMRLVEIIPAIQTDVSIPKKLLALMEKWGKTAVLVKDTPGFIVNRVARPFYSEALRIFEEGIASIETIDSAMKEIGGFRMGPFELMDFIGHQVNYRVTESMYNAFHQEARYKPSFSQLRLVQAGYLGKKTGRGFYDYSKEKNLPSSDKKLKQKVFNRIITMLINEAADAVYWNIADTKSVDDAMLKGVNYPKGLLTWADEIGIKTIVERMDNLFAMYHEERYRCSPLLRINLKNKTNFY